MAIKSLPSFQHKSIGAKTHAQGAASKHMAYIMRDTAMTKFQAENMPDGERGTRAFFDKLSEKARTPATVRVADQFIIALPLELNAQQRHEAVRSFMQALGKGRIPWCASHHDKGKDAHNPHVHILFRDVDIDTGSKVIGTTVSTSDVREAKENGWRVPPRTTTRDMRNAWCDHLNRIMEREGIDVRFDARKLKERGIDREPQIHVGPTAKTLTDRHHEFESRDALRGDHTLPYTLIDQGTRAEHNTSIVEANRQKELGARDSHDASSRTATGKEHRMIREDQDKLQLRRAQAVARQTMYQDQKLDRNALRKAQDAQKEQHGASAKQLYAKAREDAFQTVKEQFADKWQAVRDIGLKQEREKAEVALKQEQRTAYENESTRQINEARRVKDEAWKSMLADQDRQRLELRAHHRAEGAALARQQNAERNATHEKWRAQTLDKQTQRIEKQLSARQGMAAQQNAAVATLRLHGRASQSKGANGSVSVPTNPREASRHYLEQAQSEAHKHADIRATLTVGRLENIQRAPVAAPRRENVGGRPRKHFPSAAPSQDGQTNARQAMQSGRTLTDAERANAAPDVREQVERSDRRAAERSTFVPITDAKQQKPDKGRQSGGRDR